MRNGVGWAVVLPDAFLGVGGFHLLGRSNWGAYADGKRTHSSRTSDKQYLKHLTVASVEAQLQSHRRREVARWEEWLFLNLALVRAITPQLALILGGGAAKKLTIQEYLDPTEERLTDSGFYYVRDDADSGWRPNAVVMALIQSTEQVGITAGFESSPKSLSLGAFLVFR